MSLKKPIELISIIEDILPQTQCGQCGYTGCTPYANALVYNNEAINRCPPGGSIGIKKIAKIKKLTNYPEPARFQKNTFADFAELLARIF